MGSYLSSLITKVKENDNVSNVLNKVYGNNHQTVIAKFKFIPGKKNEFCELLKGPSGLELTRNFNGCIYIECYNDMNDENSLILIQKWKTRKDHEDYLKMREDSGLLEKLKENLEEPLVPIYLNYVSL